MSRTISHYEILEKLGEGGMGVVYKARDIQLQRLVALKFLPPHIAERPEEKARFIHEAQSASALNHTNVTTIYGIEESPEGMFIAMEYVEGRTLKQIIEEETLSIKKVLDIGIQMCEGMAMAHEKGVVHRDIKSDNVMVTPRGQVKIMDFGLAKLKGATKITQTGSTLGTASYMSPEQAQGEEVDQRSDIFSFGVVLYELLTGQLPFKGEHQAAIVYSVINEEPQPIVRFNNRVSAKLEDIVFKALAKEKEERYQHIDDLLADLRRERKSLEYVKTTQVPAAAVPTKPKKTLLPFIVPGSIIFVLVLLFLILKPFQLEIIPEKKAVGEENTLAIMYFENLKDKEDQGRIGEMVSELLITGLSESQYMKVVSSQRLYDLLKMMGREGARVIDKTVASEVAQKAKAKYMILGKILSTTPDLVITSQLVDVKSGNVIASQRIAGPDGTNIFTLVDSLSSEIKEDLEIPALAKKAEERPVADITTHSPGALRFYLEGNELSNKLYTKEAAEKFEQAVKIDSTFASAYLQLALVYFQLGNAVNARRSVEKAAKFSDRVSRKEKFLIDAYHQMFLMQSQEAKRTLEEMVELYPDEKVAHRELASVNSLMKNDEEAIVELKRVIELDSLDKDAYNSLAYAYDNVGRYDEAIQSINKYIRLAPGEANPYDSRGDIHAHHAQAEKAIESYMKALEIKPDFEASIEKLGFMHLYKKEYQKTESYFLQYGELGGEMARSISRADLALIPLSQGEYDLALKILNQGIAADELDRLYDQQADKYDRVARIYAEKKEFDSALQSGRKVIKYATEFYPEFLPLFECDYASLMVKAGLLDSAQKISNEAGKELKDRAEIDKSDWYFLEFEIKYARGEFAQAIREILQLTKMQPNDFKMRYWLAVSYLKSGMVGEAVQELERLSNWDILSRAENPLLSSKIPYYLGICYEESGWDGRAVEKYEEFLEIWKNADPGIAEVEDAKERVKKLRTES